MMNVTAIAAIAPAIAALQLCSQGVLPPIIGDQTTKARIFSSTIAESGNQIGSCRDDDRGTVLRIFQQETLDEKVEPRRTFRFP